MTISHFLLDCWCLSTAVNFRLTTKALYLNYTRDTSTTSSESNVVAAWNCKTIFTLYLTSILLFNYTKSPSMSSHSSTSRSALLMITSARLFTTRKPILTPTFIISPHILVITKPISLAVNSCDFAIFVLKNQTFWEKVVKWSPFLNNVDTPTPCCRTICACYPTD